MVLGFDHFGLILPGWIRGGCTQVPDAYSRGISTEFSKLKKEGRVFHITNSGYTRKRLHDFHRNLTGSKYPKSFLNFISARPFPKFWNIGPRVVLTFTLKSPKVSWFKQYLFMKNVQVYNYYDTWLKGFDNKIENLILS